MGRTGSFFALLTGIAAGITLGILYAPDKGWKTRARVRKAAENGMEDAKIGWAEAKDSFNDFKQRMLNKLDEFEDSLRKNDVAPAPEEDDIEEQEL
jgi:gas vesicle protein